MSIPLTVSCYFTIINLTVYETVQNETFTLLLCPNYWLLFSHAFDQVVGQHKEKGHVPCWGQRTHTWKRACHVLKRFSHLCNVLHIFFFNFTFFTIRRRNTSLVPTTYRMDRREMTFGGQTWLISGCPTAMRHCAMSSVFSWMQWRQMLALTQLSNWPHQHKLHLNTSSRMKGHRLDSTIFLFVFFKYILLWNVLTKIWKKWVFTILFLILVQKSAWSTSCRVIKLFFWLYSILYLWTLPITVCLMLLG